MIEESDNMDDITSLPLSSPWTCANECERTVQLSATAIQQKPKLVLSKLSNKVASSEGEENYDRQKIEPL
jgi:hypothetical protein